MTGFDLIARHYEASAIVFQPIAEALVTEFSARSKHGDVLDVGSGTGLVARCVSRRNPERSVFEMDLSSSMLNQSTASVRVVGDAAAMPFPGESFSAVVAANFLYLVPQSQTTRVLEEFRRVARPDGTVVVSWFDEESDPAWSWLSDFAQSVRPEAMTAAAGALPESVRLERSFSASFDSTELLRGSVDVNFDGPQDVLRFLLSTGFRVVLAHAGTNRRREFVERVRTSFNQSPVRAHQFVLAIANV